MNMLAAFCFIAFPCAPPRVMGYVDTLQSISHTDVYSNTRRWVNPYAAMPSMHQGYSLLFTVTIIIMLRSEILSGPSEEGVEDETDFMVDSKADADADAAPATILRTLRDAFTRITRRYDQFRVLPRATRHNPSIMFWISLIPFVLVCYPLFMFTVIVSTGNHFVLDAVAGAGAMVVAAVAYPFVLRAIVWMNAMVVKKGKDTLRGITEYVLGEKEDVELGDVKVSEEKKGFLSYTPAETA